MLASGPEEYVNDIITYFVMKGSKLEIQIRLKDILEKHPDAIILSHSLGTVVIYETLKNFKLKAHTLFTFGSPLSKAIVRKFLQVPEKGRPCIVSWFNVWSHFDPISGQIEDLGCYQKDQFQIQNSHSLLKYVHSQKECILWAYG